MTTRPINRGGQLAIGLAVIAGLLFVASVIITFRKTGAVDWWRLALAVAIPLLIYASIRRRQRADIDDRL